MMHKPRISFLILVFSLVFFIVACDEQPQEKRKESKPKVVSGKISQPIIQEKVQKDTHKKAAVFKSELQPETVVGLKDIEEKSDEQKLDEQKKDRYDSQGKIDPFKPLIQEKPEVKAVVDKGPKRILTPLEKIDINQIRLVAVIIMKNKQIAMVEEANGKGYEVGIGTYMGKNQGRVTEIKNSSIIIKELVKDFKGKLKERVQEIKLHKIDNEE